MNELNGQVIKVYWISFELIIRAYTNLNINFRCATRFRIIQLTFIIMKGLRIVVLFLTSFLIGASLAILRCEKGYSIVQNSICLQIVAHPNPKKNSRFMVPWKDAKKRCESNGGRLYEPQDERVQRVVIRGLHRNLAKFGGKINFWIGVDDIKRENQ